MTKIASGGSCLKLGLTFTLLYWFFPKTYSTGPKLRGLFPAARFTQNSRSPGSMCRGGKINHRITNSHLPLMNTGHTQYTKCFPAWHNNQYFLSIDFATRCTQAHIPLSALLFGWRWLAWSFSWPAMMHGFAFKFLAVKITLQSGQIDIKDLLTLFWAKHTAWCNETGSLTSLDAPESHASSDVREPISLHQAIL